MRGAGAFVVGDAHAGVGRCQRGTGSVARPDRSIVTLNHTEIVALIIAARLAEQRPQCRRRDPGSTLDMPGIGVLGLIENPHFDSSSLRASDRDGDRDPVGSPLSGRPRPGYALQPNCNRHGVSGRFRAVDGGHARPGERAAHGQSRLLAGTAS